MELGAGCGGARLCGGVRGGGFPQLQEQGEENAVLTKGQENRATLLPSSETQLPLLLM